MQLSVIIPTYKRSHYLIQALKSLEKQNLPTAEIVIVDNEGSEQNKQLVLASQPNLRMPLKYVHEPQLGLHHARHAGARASKGEVLIFTDDDATFHENWLDAYVKAFSDNPKMVAAGGPIVPMWESSPPKWLQRFIGDKKMFPILSLLEWGKEFFVSPQGFFFGTNMAIRRAKLFELGGFNPEAFGEIWLGNGETGLNLKLCEQQMLIGYVPDALVYHHIPAERMTIDYFKQRMANEGACDMYARFHKRMPGSIGLLWHAAFIVVRNGVVWMIGCLVQGQTGKFCLQIQLQAARSTSQLAYVRRLINDQKFRQFVLHENWLDSCVLD